MIETFMNVNNRRVLALITTETWFIESEILMLNFYGYTGFHSDRTGVSQRGRGGGEYLCKRDRNISMQHDLRRFVNNNNKSNNKIYKRHAINDNDGVGNKFAPGKIIDNDTKCIRKFLSKC